MISVLLDIADNGVVKILEDDNVNGAGEHFISKTIYTFDEAPDFKNKIRFLKDLCLDIGLETGNDLDAKKLNFTIGPGSKYKKPELTISEIKIKIKALESLIKKYNKELQQKENEIKG